MAKIFAVRKNQGYPKEVVLMHADCIDFLLRRVGQHFEKFGVKPFVCIQMDFVYMHFEAWELENLQSKQRINDFFQMYGESGMIETGDLYMDIPVEALLLLDEALAGQMEQDFNNAFI